MGQESSDGVIELKGDDPRVVEAMLQFMYMFEYNGSDQGRISPMLFNVRVYSLADKYGVSALKLRAKEKFEAAAKACWDLDDFPHVISEVYRSTPPTDRGLRDIVVRVAHEHIDVLSQKSSFRRALGETAGFAADVNHHLVRRQLPDLKRYKCPSCGHTWQAVLPCGGPYCCLHCGNRRSDWNDHVQRQAGHHSWESQVAFRESSSSLSDERKVAPLGTSA